MIDETKFKAEKNTTVIDLTTGKTYDGEFAIPDSVIERSALISGYSARLRAKDGQPERVDARKRV